MSELRLTWIVIVLPKHEGEADGGKYGPFQTAIAAEKWAEDNIGTGFRVAFVLPPDSRARVTS